MSNVHRWTGNVWQTGWLNYCILTANHTDKLAQKLKEEQSTDWLIDRGAKTDTHRLKDKLTTVSVLNE
jgi:hypothetical protein